MAARIAEKVGPQALGIGSDLCQGHPDSVVEWMRMGRWTKKIDYGEASASAAGFPDMPDWFGDNLDFPNIEAGLHAVGFDAAEVAGIMGENWLRLFRRQLRHRAAGAGPAGGRIDRVTAISFREDGMTDQTQGQAAAVPSRGTGHINKPLFAITGGFIAAFCLVALIDLELLSTIVDASFAFSARYFAL